MNAIAIKNHQKSNLYLIKPQKRLLDQVRDKIRLKHYSIRTEEAYVGWIKRYVFFHNKRHPQEMGAFEVEQFLTHLAVQGNVAASTQNQAFNALLFLYREVLGIELEGIKGLRAAKKQNLPVVMTKEEVRKVIMGMAVCLPLISIIGRSTIRKYSKTPSE